MSTVTEAPAIFRTAGWIRHHLHIGECTMLRLVAMGRIRIHAKEFSYPRYSVDDVRKWIVEEEGTPDREK